MTPSPWVETVITPRLWWRATGELVEPYEPFEVTRPIRLGPKDSGFDLVWAEPHEYELSPGPGGVQFVLRPDQNVKLVSAGNTWALPAIQFRVISSPHDSAGWPAQLARPPGPWSDETLSVLADQLLEQGRNVGQRFLTPDPKSDGLWIPAIAGRRVDPMSWRRGVIDAVAFSAPATFEFARALALQAVTAPLRQLQLRFRGSPDPSPVVSGLIAG